MISLLGLLMAVGIIVDDAIVIAESVRAGARQGLEPALAAVDGTHQVALPVLTSSATTIVAFIPLMYVEGVMGKLIYILPVVMIAAIVASAVEAFGPRRALCAARTLARIRSISWSYAHIRWVQHCKAASPRAGVHLASTLITAMRQPT